MLFFTTQPLIFQTAKLLPVKITSEVKSLVWWEFPRTFQPLKLYRNEKLRNFASIFGPHIWVAIWNLNHCFVCSNKEISNKRHKRRWLTSVLPTVWYSSVYSQVRERVARWKLPKNKSVKLVKSFNTRLCWNLVYAGVSWAWWLKQRMTGGMDDLWWQCSTDRRLFSIALWLQQLVRRRN